MINFINQQVAERFITTVDSDITIVGAGNPTKLSEITLDQAEIMLACADPNIQLKPAEKPSKKIPPTPPAEGEPTQQ
ncbi:hypothetical protein ACFOW1_01695 [Parasediminibacterium paludis]|uniref:Uncharacterized protein n=1 Tax=Parasediminibacterium paludis TaxID=908966 RepID=A0ABV8PTL5_9BACT